MPKLPCDQELICLACRGVTEIRSFGEPGDPYIFCHDRLGLQEGKLEVDRYVLVHKPLQFIRLWFTPGEENECVTTQR